MIIDNDRKKITEDDKWLIYVIENCEYCKKAIYILNKNNKIVKIYNIDIKHSILYKKDSRGYYPLIFKGGSYIGTYENLQKIFPNDYYIKKNV
jgi:glutaredoxin